MKLFKRFLCLFTVFIFHIYYDIFYDFILSLSIIYIWQLIKSYGFTLTLLYSYPYSLQLLVTRYK